MTSCSLQREPRRLQPQPLGAGGRGGRGGGSVRAGEKGRSAVRDDDDRGPGSRRSAQSVTDRAGGGYGRGTCLSRGNVGIVSEELQTFRSKERARREFVGEKNGGVWEKNGGSGKRRHFVKANFCGKEKCIFFSAYSLCFDGVRVNVHVLCT